MKLALRVMNPSDAPVVEALHRFDDYQRLRIDPEDVGDYHDAQVSHTLVILDEDEIVGTIMTVYEPDPYLGFWIAAPHRGRGLMRAALRAYFRIWAVRGTYTAECWTDNEACRRTLLGIGFTESLRDEADDGVRRFTRHHVLGSIT